MGILDFSAESSLFVQAALFRFSGLRTMVHGTIFLASVFSRNLNIVTAIKVLPPRPSAGDKHNGQGRNGTVVEVWGKGGVIYNSM